MTRDRFRDVDEADRPITVEVLALTEVADDELISYGAIFDPDDINGATAELTARWIASGEGRASGGHRGGTQVERGVHPS